MIRSIATPTKRKGKERKGKKRKEKKRKEKKRKRNLILAEALVSR